MLNAVLVTSRVCHFRNVSRGKYVSIRQHTSAYEGVANSRRLPPALLMRVYYFTCILLSECVAARTADLSPYTADAYLMHHLYITLVMCVCVCVRVVCLYITWETGASLCTYTLLGRQERLYVSE